MEILATIRDEDVFEDAELASPSTNIRTAVRAVLFDDDNKVPILYVTSRDFHKLPGGGVEEGEELSEALSRECFEETGCEIEVTGSVGIIKELRYHQFSQTSYCYLGKIIRKVQPPQFDGYEIAEGYELKWLTLDEAIEAFDGDEPNDYSSAFIKIRDTKFLRKAKDITVHGN